MCEIEKLPCSSRAMSMSGQAMIPRGRLTATCEPETGRYDPCAFDQMRDAASTVQFYLEVFMSVSAGKWPRKPASRDCAAHLGHCYFALSHVDVGDQAHVQRANDSNERMIIPTGDVVTRVQGRERAGQSV